MPRVTGVKKWLPRSRACHFCRGLFSESAENLDHKRTICMAFVPGNQFLMLRNTILKDDFYFCTTFLPQGLLTNVGTKSTFKHGHCKHFQKKSKHLLGSEVSWCDHRLAQAPKEAFSEVRVHTGATQVDFKADRPPLADLDSPPGDILITMVEETIIIYKKEFRKNEKKWNLFVSLIDLIVTKTILTGRLLVTVSSVQTWL